VGRYVECAALERPQNFRRDSQPLPKASPLRSVHFECAVPHRIHCACSRSPTNPKCRAGIAGIEAGPVVVDPQAQMGIIFHAQLTVAREAMACRSMLRSASPAIL